LYGEVNEKLEDLSVRIKKRGDGTIIDIQKRAEGNGSRETIR
jgi:hypothetical protein